MNTNIISDDLTNHSCDALGNVFSFDFIRVLLEQILKYLATCAPPRVGASGPAPPRLRREQQRPLNVVLGKVTIHTKGKCRFSLPEVGGSIPQ